MAIKYLEIGQVLENKQGEKYVIEGLDHCKSVKVRFLSNNSVKYTTANYAYRGIVRMERVLVGEQYLDKNGETITVVGKTKQDDITIQWDDGETRSTNAYRIENRLVIRTNDNKHVNPTVKVGQIYVNRQGSEIKVLEYENSTKILVEIGERKYQQYVHAGNLISLNVHDKYAPSVAGKGIFGDAEVDVKSQVYTSWAGMLKRCYTFYDDKPRARINYEGCEVREDFLYLPDYMAWYEKQIVQPKWHLDKDLLVPGNKIYSPDTCVFLPRALNTFLTVRGNERGPYPIGVTYHERLGKYEACCNRDGKSVYLGLYLNPEDAFEAYKKEKESYAKDLAKRWEGVIDSRACEALMNYRVLITD
jgi:hypothetical protein